MIQFPGEGSIFQGGYPPWGGNSPCLPCLLAPPAGDFLFLIKNPQHSTTQRVSPRGGGGRQQTPHQDGDEERHKDADPPHGPHRGQSAPLRAGTAGLWLAEGPSPPHPRSTEEGTANVGWLDLPRCAQWHPKCSGGTSLSFSFSFGPVCHRPPRTRCIE